MQWWLVCGRLQAGSNDAQPARVCHVTAYGHAQQMKKKRDTKQRVAPSPRPWRSDNTAARARQAHNSPAASGQTRQRSKLTPGRNLIR